MHRSNPMNTQKRLRQAAIDLFSIHGYQSTSLRNLADHLGIQAGSLYNHIENKQSLLFELMEETLEVLLADTRARIRRGSTPYARLRLFVQAFVLFQARERKRLALLEREEFNLCGEQRERIYGLRAEYAECLKDVIDGVLGAVPEGRPNVLVHVIMGMLQSLSLWREDECPVSSEELVDQLTSMISGAIGAARR
ncbi:AcrR family transcriptional regulator [Pseudomonas citronellolis]|uniref:TetR/AcrR family transcriptional regulator n=1 Tax=Pseudomonas citronellolis TaxID=53408 RepID=UPI00209CF7B5|nr:TetR/AcrR family transcriptional regulator [Pseudomonas citronellolis]MCP1645007.1 AcrR family transcriptional regulator [Pseudomonas citronellolis]MCP1667993.1 AcrR family transcriptional regulator [Pseudomonas citronellolis]MCP1699161.1 AcrR family transcriptional regulator [Pseudomonas citronellolis]MCP1705692.1 AcrR family transcriptional regulator [Pseudomonas citronellolis]MCP1799725.1 AcrR family transcriptional regulator [Pseudomonas citronellolis]